MNNQSRPARRAASVAAPIALLAALSACSTDRPAGFAAALPPPPVMAQRPADGAIFSAASGYAPLHYGNRASRVGDLVTVVLVERTQSSKSARASTDRDGSFAITPPSLGPFSFNPGNLNSGSSTSFNGQGNAAQTSTIRADITVSVAEILPGGIVRVQGEKLMNLSQGEEWIQLSGLLRLADIDADNRVASTRIADARIGYGGKGSVQRASRQGWLGQFFALVSPF